MQIPAVFFPSWKLKTVPNYCSSSKPELQLKYDYNCMTESLLSFFLLSDKFKELFMLQHIESDQKTIYSTFMVTWWTLDHI